jgi:hypothetical protein
MNLVWPGNGSGAETWRDESGRGKRGLVAGAVLYLPLFRMFVFISEDFYSINVFCIIGIYIFVCSQSIIWYIT